MYARFCRHGNSTDPLPYFHLTWHESDGFRNFTSAQHVQRAPRETTRMNTKCGVVISIARTPVDR